MLEAASAEEIIGLAKAAGSDISAEEAGRIFETAQVRKQDRQLSPDELESVSGGKDRNWVTDGCAATVEFPSWYDSNDWCIWWNVTYEYGPTGNICPNCGKQMYRHAAISLGGDQYEDQYKCKYCGCITSKTYYVVDD